MAKEQVTTYISNLAKGQITKKERAKVFIPISVGKEHCEGEQLRAQIKYLNREFKNSTFVVGIADTLQAYTYQINGYSRHEALQKAKEAGEAWEVNKKIILDEIMQNNNNNTIEYQYWNDLTQSNDKFPGCLAQIETKYSTDSNFKTKYLQTAYHYSSNQLDKSIVDPNNLEHGPVYSLKYLKEENAVNIYLSQNGFDYCAYAGGITDSIQATYDAFIEKDKFCYLFIKTKPDNTHSKAASNTATRLTPQQSNSPLKSTIISNQLSQNHFILFSPPTNANNILESEASYLFCLKTIIDNNTIPIETRLNMAQTMLQAFEQKFKNNSTIYIQTVKM